MDTLPLKSLVYALKEVSSAHQGCIYLIKNTAECSASLLQSSVSHDPSEITLIWGFDAQETFMIIINVENIFCRNRDT